MSTATGRTDRRRRILNDGVRSSGAASSPSTEVGGEVSRYAANDDSVSFAVARRVAPHRRRAILGVLAVGSLGIAGLLAGHHYQSEIVTAAGVASIPAIDLSAPTSLARWATSFALIAAAGLCLLVYGLRRHRSDDVRGLYRWWFSAAMASTAASIAVATDLHQSLANIAAAKTGWSPFAEDAFWWLAPATVILGAIVIRTVLDLKHCVPALFATVMGLGLGCVMIAATYGWLPAAARPWSLMIAHGAALGGLLMIITALLSYCRRIVLEADGAIKAPVQKPTPKAEKKSVASPAKSTATTKKATTAATATKPTPKIAASTTTASRATPSKRAEAAKPTPTQWTDGSDGDTDYGDDGDGPRRKLSKSERKRLRKLKARQNRAA